MAGHLKSLGTGVILLCVGFFLGIIYSNWSYDYWLLWVNPTPDEWIQRALDHYKIKATQPKALQHVLHCFIGLAFTGFFIKLYRPSESNTLFDGGGLVLLVIATVFYITNMRPAAYSLVSGDWGDIDAATGIRLVAASQVLIVLVLLGCVAMLGGQWWAIVTDTRTAERAAAAEKAEKEAVKAANAEAADATPKATSSAVPSKKNSSKKRA